MPKLRGKQEGTCELVKSVKWESIPVVFINLSVACHRLSALVDAHGSGRSNA